MTDGKLVKMKTLDAPEREVHEVRLPRVGEWYWVKGKFTAESDLGKVWRNEIMRKADAEGDEGEMLAVVTKVGSNFIEVRSPRLEVSRYTSSQWTFRVHADEFESRLTRELNADSIIKQQTARHQGEVKRLMGEIQELTARLGVGQLSLADGNSAGETAALVRVTSDAPVTEYKSALQAAKSKTLPQLFEKVELETRFMSGWMLAELLAVRVEAEEGMAPLIERIDNRVFNVELYAGLLDDMVRVRRGAPATVGEPVHLFQRRHYMDEEYLAVFNVRNRDTVVDRGNDKSLDSRDLLLFDKWVAQEENFKRLFPFPRTVVAFRIRRFDKDYTPRGDEEIHELMKFASWTDELKREGRYTFLFIRNGEQLYRLRIATKHLNDYGQEIEDPVEFQDELFPDEHLQHLVGHLYAKLDGPKVLDVITSHDFEVRCATYKQAQEEYPRLVSRYEHALTAWRKKHALLMKPRADYWGHLIGFETYQMRRLCMAEGGWLDDAVKVSDDGIPRELRSSMWGSAILDCHHERVKKVGVTAATIKDWRTEFEAELAQAKATQPERPQAPVDDSMGYTPFDDTNVYYDEIQKWLADKRNEHNRLVLILQGLLDRSEALHPHPKWELWTETGFANALTLHYDSKRALTPSEMPPSWEDFKAQKNSVLKAGSVVLGADAAWRYWKKLRRAERSRRSDSIDYKTEEDGPGYAARVVRVEKDGRLVFSWRKKREFWGHSTRWGGYRKPKDRITMVEWSCKPEAVFCLDDYRPGEFKQFFADPRTRQTYKQWAHTLLTAEMYVYGQLPVTEPLLAKKRPAKDPNGHAWRQMGTRDEFRCKNCTLLYVRDPGSPDWKPPTTRCENAVLNESDKRKKKPKEE